MGLAINKAPTRSPFFTALILITTVTITRGKGNKTEIARRIHGPLIYMLTILSNQLLLLMNWQTGTDGENWSSREDLCKVGLVYSKPLPYTPANDGESKEPAKEENVMNKSRIFYFLRNYTTFFAFHPSHTHRLRVRSGEVSTPHVSFTTVDSRKPSPLKLISRASPEGVEKKDFPRYPTRTTGCECLYLATVDCSCIWVYVWVVV